MEVCYSFLFVMFHLAFIFISFSKLLISILFLSADSCSNENVLRTTFRQQHQCTMHLKFIREVSAVCTDRRQRHGCITWFCFAFFTHAKTEFRFAGKFSNRIIMHIGRQQEGRFPWRNINFFLERTRSSKNKICWNLFCFKSTDDFAKWQT